jgi:hypothetical protein
MQYPFLDNWFYLRSRRRYQLAVFRANPANKGKVLRSGFGDIQASQLLWRYSSVVGLWTDLHRCRKLPSRSWFIINDSIDNQGLRGSLARKKSHDKKPEYRDYIEKTSAFIPWFPKK